MKIGFTGTRQGMSASQMAGLHGLLYDWLRLGAGETTRASQFHHGGAAGADLDASVLAEARGLTVITHPAGRDPLARNRIIVAEADLLIAAPAGDKETLRSGTWATVRYARAAGKPVVMLSRGKG